MQTINVNNVAHGDATEATVFGPFFIENSPRIDNGGDIAGGAAGQPCWVEGTVTDVEGRPIPHARIEVWEADEDGFYDVQYTDDRVSARAHLFSDDDGRYRFWCSHPDSLPDSARWPGRPDARCHRTLPDARFASALHGVRPWPTHPGDPHFRRG